jgi:hypothetical protein
MPAIDSAVDAIKVFRKNGLIICPSTESIAAPEGVDIGSRTRPHKNIIDSGLVMKVNRQRKNTTSEIASPLLLNCRSN